MTKSKKSKIEQVHVDEASKLKSLYEERIELSQAAFGHDYGIGSQGMVWQYLNAKSPLNLDAALKFARGLNCSVSDFSPRLAERLKSDQAASPATADIPKDARQFRPASEVPVVGTTQGGPPDRIWEELQYATGYSDEYLEVATPDGHAYALRVVGSSMAPRIMEGEWLLVEPTGEAQPGDDVVVKTTDGRVMVKVLVSSHGGSVILSSVNEAFERITVGANEIEFMHFVAGRFAARSVKRRVSDETTPARRMVQNPGAIVDNARRSKDETNRMRFGLERDASGKTRQATVSRAKKGAS